MRKKHKHLVPIISGACLLQLVLATIVLSQGVIDTTTPQLHYNAPLALSDPSSPFLAEAIRLRDRLIEQRNIVPSLTVLEQALADRQQLLFRTITVSLMPDTGTGAIASISLALADQPEWVQLQTDQWSASFHVDVASIQAALDRGDISGLSLAENVEVTSMQEDNKHVLRATTTGLAKPGYTLDTAYAAVQIAAAFEHNISTVQLAATRGTPTVTVTEPNGTKKTLPLLSTGYSDFKGSTPGRLHNLHKALEERVNNVVLRPGETFSLVAALDAPITLQKGWLEDLGLFGGGAALTPGAGICQSATTTYRAAILAGLPIVRKINHSLFVNHYELLGIGLDATVFPGVADLQFKNDSNDYLVMQAYTDGNTAMVNLYGTSDGRTVSLDGPYFATPGSKPRPKELRPLSLHQIGWVQTIKNADGSIRDVHPIVATYAKPLWHSLIKRWNTAEGMAIMTPDTLN